LRAVLTYTEKENGQPVEHTRLFDTEQSEKICDVKNSFGKKVQEIYISRKGKLFLHNIYKKNLEVADQRQTKRWIGENDPDKYIKFFGEVEEG